VLTAQCGWCAIGLPSVSVKRMEVVRDCRGDEVVGDEKRRLVCS
jgi:hypothetical protein